MANVVPAEGVILERVLDATHSISPEGLSREAYAKCDAAQMKTAWGRHHQRRFALMDGANVLASAIRYDLAAVPDQRPVRVCGIGAILTPPLHRGGDAMELVERLLDQAALDGAACALVFSDMSHEYQPAGFDVVSMTEADLSVAESSRRGAPMTLIRGGEERDLAAIVAMGQGRASSFGFHLDRDVDFVQYAITKKRLLAGLGQPGARQLHFFIAEEGITGCCVCRREHRRGVHGPSRSAATVIPLVRESAPFYKRSSRVSPWSAATIRAWLPRGFVPPQVTIVSAKPSTDVLMVRSLGSTVQPRLSGDDVLYWRGDIF